MGRGGQGVLKTVEPRSGVADPLLVGTPNELLRPPRGGRGRGKRLTSLGQERWVPMDDVHRPVISPSPHVFGSLVAYGSGRADPRGVVERQEKRLAERCGNWDAAAAPLGGHRGTGGGPGRPSGHSLEGRGRAHLRLAVDDILLHEGGPMWGRSPPIPRLMFLRWPRSWSRVSRSEKAASNSAARACRPRRSAAPPKETLGVEAKELLGSSMAHRGPHSDSFDRAATAPPAHNARSSRRRQPNGSAP